NGNQSKALGVESTIRHQRAPEIPSADQQHVPGFIRPQDLLDLGDQLINPVSDSGMTKLPKVSQILPDLRVGEIEALTKLLTGNRPAVLALERFKLPQVKAEATDSRVGDQVGSGLIHECGEIISDDQSKQGSELRHFLTLFSASATVRRASKALAFAG